MLHRWYGAGPGHLLALAVGFAVAGSAATIDAAYPAMATHSSSTARFSGPAP